LPGINNTVENLLLVSGTPAMKQQINLPTPQGEHRVKNHFMTVNSNPTASKQNMKKLSIQKFFPFISGVVDTVISFYFRIPPRILVKKWN
jgi:hypothetical protein